MISQYKKKVWNCDVQQLSFSLISLENIPSSTTVLHTVQRLSLEAEKLIPLDCGPQVCTDIDALPAPWARSLWGAVSKRKEAGRVFHLPCQCSFGHCWTLDNLSIVCMMLKGHGFSTSDPFIWSSLTLIKKASINFNFLALCLGSNPTFSYLSSLIYESLVMHFPYKAWFVCCSLYVSKGFRLF